MDACIFCKIIADEIPSFQIWEDESHRAFLSVFPNTEGVTVVVPKKHYASYAFDLEDAVLRDLVLATKKVAKILDAKLEDVGRCAMVFEGFGVDHVHAKLFPMHGTKDMQQWKSLESDAKIQTYFEKYPGYISSHDAAMAEENDLKKTQRKIIS